MSQTLFHSLPHEQEESLTISVNKEVVLPLSVLFALLNGGILWWFAVIASHLQPVQQWQLALLIAIVLYCSGSLVLLPLRLLLTRSPLLTFTQEGIYNYYHLASQPLFLKWEDVEEMRSQKAWRKPTALKIRRVPSEGDSLVRQQRGVLLILLSHLFYRYAVDIPQWVMLVSVEDLLQQVKQKYARALQDHHIRLALVNGDTLERHEI